MTLKEMSIREYISNIDFKYDTHKKTRRSGKKNKKKNNDI